MAGFVEKGGDRDVLLISLGFEPIAKMSNKLMSVSEFHTLTLALEQHLQDEMLGFLSTPMPIGSRSFINKNMTQLPTLKSAIHCLNEFYALFNNGKKVFEIIEKSGQQELRLNMNGALQSSSPYFSQRMLLGSYKQLCWLVKSIITLEQIDFSCSLENGLSELQHVFGCNNIRQAKSCRLIFKEDVFEKAVVQGSEGAEIFSDNANLYTLLWPNLEALDLKIRLMIGQDISEGFPGFTEIASRMKVSTQTLSRWLHEQGTSYQTIKDDIRRETAMALLSNSKLSVKEIAFKLGFQESSAFSKAFKNWFSMTATCYRDKALLSEQVNE